MNEKGSVVGSLVLSLAVALTTPALKWLLDLLSQTFGKRRLDYRKTRMEFYKYLLSVTDDQNLKGQIDRAIHDDIQRFLPAREPSKATVFVSYASVPIWKCVQRVCHDTLPWLISVSVDQCAYGNACADTYQLFLPLYGLRRFVIE